MASLHQDSSSSIAPIWCSSAKRLFPSGMCEGGEEVGGRRGYKTGAAPVAPMQEEPPTLICEHLTQGQAWWRQGAQCQPGSEGRSRPWRWCTSISFEHLCRGGFSWAATLPSLAFWTGSSRSSVKFHFPIGFIVTFKARVNPTGVHLLVFSQLGQGRTEQPSRCWNPRQIHWRARGLCGAAAVRRLPPAGLGVPFITGDGPCRGTVT